MRLRIESPLALRRRLLFPALPVILLPFLAAPAEGRTRLPSLSISPPRVTIVEPDAGTTKATFLVRLSAPARKVVLVRFATSDFTATQGADYRAGKGTLTFKRGERLKRIVVLVAGDALAEDREEFSVRLSRPQNARLGASQSNGRILENDLPPPFAVNAALKPTEGPGTGVVTITLDAPKGELTFALQVQDWPHTPLRAHIYSRSMALGGSFPSLLPVPSRNGSSTGTVSIARRTILLIDANPSDFYAQVHSADGNQASDLIGELRRTPSP